MINQELLTPHTSHSADPAADIASIPMLHLGSTDLNCARALVRNLHCVAPATCALMITCHATSERRKINIFLLWPLPRTSHTLAFVPHTQLELLTVFVFQYSPSLSITNLSSCIPRALQQAKRQQLMETLPLDDIESDSDDDNGASSSVLTTRCVGKCVLRVSPA